MGPGYFGIQWHYGPHILVNYLSLYIFLRCFKLNGSQSVIGLVTSPGH